MCFRERLGAMAHRILFLRRHDTAGFARVVVEKNRVLPEAVGAMGLVDNLASRYPLANPDYVRSGVIQCNDRAELRAALLVGHVRKFSKYLCVTVVWRTFCIAFRKNSRPAAERIYFEP